jgi:hypothetical protein
VLHRHALDDLIGSFPMPGIDHLHAGPMLMARCTAGLLPGVKDDRDGMSLSLPVRRQLTQELLPSGFPIGTSSDLASGAQQIVAVDDQVLHERTQGSLHYDIATNVV